MSIRIASSLIIPVCVFFCACNSDRVDAASTDTATTDAQAQEEDELRAWNHRIRREKFDIVLPEVMRKSDVDMWIHVMRETIPDPFGAEDLGSTSGVFVFTDRGGDRIERAVLGRRWGASHAGETWRVTWETESVEESGTASDDPRALGCAGTTGTAHRRYRTLGRDPTQTHKSPGPRGW